MTESDDPQGEQSPSSTPPSPEVGSVGEEAMKLFGALADLARQQGTEVGASLGGLADHAGSLAKEVNDHIATDSAECKYCPVCRVVHAVRETSPDVKTHLLSAATSLLQAAAGMLETLPPPDPAGAQRGPEVQRINLDGGDDELHPDDVW
ncbi:hypothetical protein F0U44_15120 [Nocardioides humilatus]|uniref:Uncharacterized protein n=1 Tax=Nocardioides humilatus TaxID=2607660 RepID=A0A5B1LB49_9ACTN|nr:hypothetical protein [Nocardioides humilatus]KAA1417963.1 hypothetical protein F0U44_15120 [Nocardioides humilatus]